jgi:hypothetical protein
MSIFKATAEIVHQAMMADCNSLPVIALEFTNRRDAAVFMQSVVREALPENQVVYHGGDTVTINGVAVVARGPRVRPDPMLPKGYEP